MGRWNASIGGALVALIAAWAVPALAQGDADRQSLRTQLDQRFTVFLVRDGVMLESKRAGSGVRAIQVTGGDIAIDGDPVTGAELRRRLGADADPVIRLSYLDSFGQRALFAQAPAVVPPNEPQAPSEPRAPRPPRPPRPPRSSRGPDRVRIGGGVQVGEGEVVGDVVAIGGSARVDGEAGGNVVAIGGDVDLGPHADVDGDVTVIGGVLRRDPAARVGGQINDIGLGGLNLLPHRLREWRPPNGPFLWNSALGSVFAFVTTVTRLAVLCLLASIVLVFGREHVDRIGSRVAADPLRAGLVGLVIQLLFFPVLLVTVVVMIVTIIGIPLLALVPFAVIALALLLLVGFTAVVSDVGRFAATRFGWQEQNRYIVATIGVAVVLSPVLVARLVSLAGGVLAPFAWALLLVGFLAEYAAWTVGLGAIALARFDRKALPPLQSA